MNVSIFRFSTSVSVALISLVALAGVTAAQDAEAKKLQSEAKEGKPAVTRHYFLPGTRPSLQRRYQLSEAVAAKAMEAYLALPKDPNLNPPEEVDSSLISNYWIGVQCYNAGATAFSPKEAPDLELTVEGGMEILAVTEGGAAEESGLEEGDVLLKFGGNDVASLNDLYAAIGETKDNEALMLVVRDGALLSMKITPQERPQEPNESDDSDQFQALDPSIHKIQLWNVEDAMKQEMMGKQLPEGYRLQVELVRGRDIMLKVTKGDETWNADRDSIKDLPEPIQAAASGIVEACEPLVAADGDELWRMAWQANATPTYRRVLEGTQLDDIRSQLKQLAEAVKKLEDKLDD